MREKFQKREKPEFEQRLVDIARVTRVMAGGKRLRFRACVVIGDMNGRVGWGIAKGADVSIAINKAVSKAKKQMITVNIYKNTIAHEVKKKFKSALIYLKPAPVGRGVIAGGVVRDVMELAGIKDIIAKMYGSNSKINNVRATFEALSELRLIEDKKSDSEEKVLEKSEPVLLEDMKKEDKKEE